MEEEGLQQVLSSCYQQLAAFANVTVCRRPVLQGIPETQLCIAGAQSLCHVKQILFLTHLPIERAPLSSAELSVER